VTATEKLYGSTYDAGINSIDTHARKFNPAGVPDYKSAPASLQPLPPLQYFAIQYGRTPNSEVNALGMLKPRLAGVIRPPAHLSMSMEHFDSLGRGRIHFGIPWGSHWGRRVPTRQPWQASVFRY
jgi:hypothetical protein